MDHQAFAEMLNNCGEFFGALAVVATLRYLAFQVRQNARSSYVTRSNEHLGWSDNIAGEFGLQPDQYERLSSHYFRIIGHLRDAYVSQLPEGEGARSTGKFEICLLSLLVHNGST